MKVIVGLGNPGHTYHDSRHNVGFMVLQHLAERHGAPFQQRLVTLTEGRPAGIWGEYRAGEETVRVLMPLTMMNESGEALRAAAVNPNELLVVCDDVNLPLSAIRLRPQGGAGGHHGLQSCLEALGTEQFARLRVGVGTSSMPRDLHEFVLSPFRDDERQMIQQAVEQAAEACEAWVTDGIEVAMNRYNRTQDVDA